METTASQPIHMRSAILLILFAGFVAGTLDALAAIVVYKADPAKLFQFIASAAFGKSAFQETSAIVWGVAFHYLIAITWSALYFAVQSYMARVIKPWVLRGVVWGEIVWAGMNLVVLPMTQLARGPFDLKQAALGMTIIIFAVGIPISFLIRRSK
jgi:hypothetical protein